jgi:hypothetical protein
LASAKKSSTTIREVGMATVGVACSRRCVGDD